MREIHDSALFASYMKEYELDGVFPDPLMPYVQLMHYNQGDMICKQGERADTLYVLVSGKIKIYTTSPEGKALIISFKTPLEVIGDIEYIQGNPLINTVQAILPTYMIAIPYRWLRLYGNEYPPLLRFLLHIITKKFHAKSDFMSFNLMHPVEVRLASYLLSVSSNDLESLQTDPMESSNLTDIANLLGTSYRHLNRVIQKFCADGLIKRHRGRLTILNRDGLIDVAGSNIYEK